MSNKPLPIVKRWTGRAPGYRGDMSQWGDLRESNFNGVLHQQGKVLLDRDWNDQIRILNKWQDRAGQDIVGPGVAAIPANNPDAWLVQEAAVVNQEVQVKLRSGSGWADGLPFTLDSDDPVSLVATYLEPPTQSPAANVASIANGVRDAVVLELWREDLNAFQVPAELLEPALGGPDTTLRIQTAARLRLLRMDKDDTCESVISKIQDDLNDLGRLTVTLKDPVTIPDEDCPVEEGGGYTGFEHFLYRIEIAKTNVGPRRRFKWSQVNGGLVGRGKFEAGNGGPNKVQIQANSQAINHSGLDDFYLEVVEFDEDEGYWRVTYGAEVSLDNSDLKVSKEHYVETELPSGTVFFRLWNGILHIDDYTASPPGTPKTLLHGIRLAFETGGGIFYRPGDYWTFSVRAGEIENPQVLINRESPHGIQVHRVPLAILYWTGGRAIRFVRDEIKDCRKIFHPLTDLPHCGCCVPVWPEDDLHKIVKELIEEGGGCVCLMPGDHRLLEPLDLSGVSNLHFKGYGLASRLLIAFGGRTPGYVFRLRGSNDVSFRSFAIFSQQDVSIWMCQAVRDLVIEDMFVYADVPKAVHPIISAPGSSSDRWHLADNVFLGATALAGDALHRSSVEQNVWVGTRRGIKLGRSMGLRVERNHLAGLTTLYREALDKRLRALATRVTERSRSRLKIDALRRMYGREIAGGTLPRALEREFGELAPGIEVESLEMRRVPFEGRAASIRLDLEEELRKLFNLLASPKSDQIIESYIGFDVSGAFELVFAENRVFGGIGLNAEIIEDGRLLANSFVTKLYGASCGLAHGLRFAENRIGVRRGSGRIQCQVGLRILADAIDCRIQDNHFRNVREGVVFETDSDGKREKVRVAETYLLPKSAINKTDARALFNKASTFGGELYNARTLINHSYFRIGKCERTLIQGNVFECEQVAIEWSGTKEIIDFRVSGNTFLGCQDTAIQIEPDGRIPLVAEKVDTKVRLIEKNRFEVFSGAVRSTIGSVRVEKNDIWIKAPKLRLLPTKPFFGAIATHVYKVATLTNAVAIDDYAMVDMAKVEVVNKAAKNPATVSAGGFYKALGDTVLTNYNPVTATAETKKAFTMGVMADIGLVDLVVHVAGWLYPFLKNKLEGYAVNLTGAENRAVHNRLLSENGSIHGGVVFHLLSGEVRDNDIQVPRTALMMAGKVLGAANERRNAEVAGNLLRITGQKTPGKKSSPSYALIIPTLTPGHLSISTNYFEGSVMIGGDPNTSTGFKLKEVYEKRAVDKYFMYSAMKSDSWAYIGGLMDAFKGSSKPAMEVKLLEPNFAIVVGLFDPHSKRPVVQFSDNRVVRGLLSISRSAAGKHLSQAQLKSQANSSIVLNASNNVVDYQSVFVGQDLILVGNHSSWGIRYRVGGRIEKVANIPDPQLLT